MAASEPAGPPPTTTTFFGFLAKALSGKYFSRPVAALTAHRRSRLLPTLVAQYLQPMHFRISSRRCSLIFKGNLGSARKALPKAIKSAEASVKTFSANKGSFIRPTTMTGISTACLINRAVGTNIPWGTEAGPEMNMPESYIPEAT